jgi:hypothetical protein
MEAGLSTKEKAGRLQQTDSVRSKTGSALFVLEKDLIVYVSTQTCRLMELCKVTDKIVTQREIAISDYDAAT